MGGGGQGSNGSSWVGTREQGGQPGGESLQTPAPQDPDANQSIVNPWGSSGPLPTDTATAVVRHKVGPGRPS